MECTCRICYEDDQVENLESPCCCSGSIKYVHRECLLDWCNYKSEAVCEICHEHYPLGYVAGEETTFMQILIRLVCFLVSAVLVLPAVLPLFLLGPFWLLLFLIRGRREDPVDDADMQEYGGDVDPANGGDLDENDVEPYSEGSDSEDDLEPYSEGSDSEDDLEPYSEDTDSEDDQEITLKGGDAEKGDVKERLEP